MPLTERLRWRMGKEMKQELLGTLMQDRGPESTPGGHMGPAWKDSGSLEEGDRKSYHHPSPLPPFCRAGPKVGAWEKVLEHEGR